MRLILPSSVADTMPAEVDETPGRSTRLLLIIATGIWIATVAGGLGFLMAYANRPGDQGDAISEWPEASPISLARDRPTLLLFAHPKCPCTKASIGELDWIMTRCGDDVDSHVLFFQPDGETEDWCRTSCWARAVMIPNVDVSVDPESRMARQFGIKTSGHVLLYAPDGELLFEGGITQSRGHAGESPGRTRLVSLIREHANLGGSDGGRSNSKDSPSSPRSDADRDSDSTCVFGCPLHDPEVAARSSPSGERG